MKIGTKTINFQFCVFLNNRQVKMANKIRVQNYIVRRKALNRIDDIKIMNTGSNCRLLSVQCFYLL
jgi:hypothetical protein